MKKAISIILSVLMIISVTAGLDFSAYAETTHPTSTNSLYSNRFQGILDELKSTKYYDSMYNSFVCIIPGIEQTNTGDGTYSNYMTPQGVCVAGPYILITAYDSIDNFYNEMNQQAPENKKNSVIYVLDKKTNKYLATVVLDSKCHVGGISYNQKAGLIYIADSDNKQVCMLNYSDITDAVNKKQDAVKVKFSRFKKVSVNPSFLTYYGGYLYIGNFVDNKANEKDSILKAYNPISLAEIDNSTIKLPLKSQGVAFINYDNEIMMTVSCSYGRKNKSQVFAYRMKKSGNVLQKVSEFDYYKFPEMAEGICVYGDKFLTCYESAAARYQNDNSKIGKCANPIDRITANSISKVAESYYNTMSLSENEHQSTEEFESVVLSGSCGNDAEYVLYSNGLFNITGQGKLYDYAENEAPWSDYADKILAVTIAPDIDSIGKNSFISCNNLSYIYVSDFSDINESFTISSNAFANCNAIDTVSLPDKSIVIADDAFDNSNTQMGIISDSQDAIDFAQKNNFGIHKHDYRYVKTVAPTCGSNGYDIYECSCYNQELQNITKVTDNHNYVLSEDTKVCLAGETRLYTCTKCQSTYDKVLTNDSHNFDGVKCTVCNEPDPNYNPPSVDPAPSPGGGGGGGGGGAPAPTPEPETPEETEQKPETTPTPTPAPTTPSNAITYKGETIKPNANGEYVSKKAKKPVISKLTKGRKAFKITWKKISGVSGYQIQYSTSKNFTKKTTKSVYIKGNKKFAKTIKNLKGTKKYYVRIRTYKIVNGKKIFSTWSKVKTVVTTK